MSSSFEDLEVWKKSCRLTVLLYGLLKDCRDYGIKDQMLRAAVSIASNIAEGCERNSKAEFRRYLRISKGSAAELRTQLYISREVKTISHSDANRLISELISISKMLQGLIASLSSEKSHAV